MTKYRAARITDAVTTCDCCGRKNLKCTVEMVVVESGEVVHFGRACAANALGWRLNEGKTEIRVREITERAILREIDYSTRRIYRHPEHGNAGDMFRTGNGLEVLQLSLVVRPPSGEGWQMVHDRRMYFRVAA